MGLIKNKRNNGMTLFLFCLMAMHFVYTCYGQGSFDYREMDHAGDYEDFPILQSRALHFTQGKKVSKL